MEFNRNQYFMIGLVVLFLGIQFRMVESFVLNAETSQFIAERLKKDDPEPIGTSLFASNPPVSYRSVQPPKWIGWMLVSVGAVLVLHSFAMPRPG